MIRQKPISFSASVGDRRRMHRGYHFDFADELNPGPTAGRRSRHRTNRPESVCTRSSATKATDGSSKVRWQRKFGLSQGCFATSRNSHRLDIPERRLAPTGDSMHAMHLLETPSEVLCPETNERILAVNSSTRENSALSDGIKPEFSNLVHWQKQMARIVEEWTTDARRLLGLGATNPTPCPVRSDQRPTSRSTRPVRLHRRNVTGFSSATFSCGRYPMKHSRSRISDGVNVSNRPAGIADTLLGNTSSMSDFAMSSSLFSLVRTVKPCFVGITIPVNT